MGRSKGRQALFLSFPTVVLFLALAIEAHAQATTGLPPFSTVHEGLIDTVKVNDGSILLSLPVLGKAGLIPFNYSLNTNVNVSLRLLTYAQIIPQLWWNAQTSIGLTPSISVSGTYGTPVNCPGGTGKTEKVTNYVFADGLGTKHPLPGLFTDTSQCYPEQLSGLANDGSGYGVVLNPGGSLNTLTDKGGNIITPPPGILKYKDTNSNQITISNSCVPTACGTDGKPYVSTYSYNDTTGNVVMADAQSWNPSPVLHITKESHTWTDANGPQSFTVNYSTYIVQTNFGCQSGGLIPQDDAAQSTALPSSITTPVGTYTISYESQVTGTVTARISKIGFPSGASVQYAYTGGPYNTGINCVSSFAVPLVVPILTRTLTDDQGTVRVWKYDTTQGATITVVTDPAANDTVYTFGGSGRLQLETERVTYQGSWKAGNILRTQITCYNGYVSNWQTACPTGYGAGKPVFQKDVYTTLKGLTQASLSETKYDGFGDLTDDKDYDFGLTTLLSDHVFVYGTFNSSNNTCQPIGSNINDRVCSDTVQDSTPSIKSQSLYYYDPHGNRIQSSSLVSGTGNGLGTYVTSSATYNANGTVQYSYDANQNKTTYTYGDCNGTMPTLVQRPLNLSRSMTWNCIGGVLATATDENSQMTQYKYVSQNGNSDPFWRLVEVDYPDHGQTTATYNDTAKPPNIVISQLINSSLTRTTQTNFDGFGHPTQTALTSDPQGTTYTVKVYDALERLGTVYNSTRCNPPTTNCGEATWGHTSYNYDALDRVVSVVEADGSTISTTYTGRATDVVDEGNGTRGIERVSQVDGLGRLVSACEVTGAQQLGIGGTPAACSQDIAKTGFLTSYVYDALGDLLSVNQGTLGQRTFAYDSLSRLLCAANPETGSATCPNPDNGTYIAGTTRYTYDANGNVITRTRPAPNQTSASTTVAATYAYDALNRLKQKSYSDGVTPNVMFGYDQASVTMGTQQFNITNSIGRLSFECTLSPTTCTSAAANMNAFSYDPMGRTAQLWDCQHLNCPLPNIVFSYDYDLIGDELDYFIGTGPQGSTEYVSTYSGAGRLTSFTTPTFVDPTNPANLLTGVQYDPFGHIISGNLANGLSLSSGYDARGRVTAMAVGTNCSVGNCSTNKYRFTTGYAPNSDVVSSTDTVNGNWMYTYDDLNRLSTGVANNGEGCSWDYDRYGNRWHQNTHSGSCTTAQSSFSGNNNRIDGDSYDAAGNLLNDGFHAYQYDAENRIVSVDGGATTYIYDAEGRRYSKTTGGVPEETIYDRMGNPRIRGNFAPGEIFVAGMHLGTSIINSGHTDSIFYYDHDDWLGTERARTDLSGTACETIVSLPFGDGQTMSGTCVDISPMHFTGKERDTESGLDNFGARYDASSLGRFMTPDPLLNSGRPGSPQTWNRYAYALNNPLKIKDPTGLYNVNCGDDKGCQKSAKRLKQGLEKLQNKVDKMKDSDQKTRLEHSLGAMGTENDGNNVNVSFGAIAGTAAATTDAHFDSATNSYSSFDVKFDMSKTGNSDANGMAINGAHEGTHVGDYQDPLGRSQNPATAMDGFQYEFRGYQTSAWAAQALGVSPLSFGGNVIWNSSWAAADRQTLMGRGITGIVTGAPYNQPENPIHDPWPDRFPEPNPGPF